MHTVNEILSDYYRSEIISSIEFGNERGRTNTERSEVIGKRIIEIETGVGCYDGVVESGIFIYVQGVKNPIFVYSNERIILA